MYALEVEATFHRFVKVVFHDCDCDTNLDKKQPGPAQHLETGESETEQLN